MHLYPFLGMQRRAHTHTATQAARQEAAPRREVPTCLSSPTSRIREELLGAPVDAGRPIITTALPLAL